MATQKLAICAIFKNEAPFLLEWIAYHIAVGFEHLVLYDNDSTDGGAALIRNSPLAERVTVIHWPQRPGQLSAYRHFIDIFAPGFDWATFIDIDEFILPLNRGGISETLDRLGNASAVLVHRRVFGPSGKDERPDGLVIENYDRRAPDEFDMNRHVKSLVRCADLLDVTQNPHEFMVRGLVFNTAGRLSPNVAVQETACHEALVINHYHTRSRQDWQAKIARGSAMFDQSEPRYDVALIDHFADACQLEDRTIQSFVPEVRVLLGVAASAPPPTPAVAPPVVAPPVVTPPVVTPPVVAAQPARVIEQPVEAARGWIWAGPNAQQHTAALVFRDGSRDGKPWLAALRGRPASLVDPDFLVDQAGRIRDFATDAEARAACEAALTT